MAFHGFDFVVGAFQRPCGDLVFVVVVFFFSFFDALTDPVFFNKNIHSDEISSLILILPAMITGIPDCEAILDQIETRIDAFMEILK